MEQMGEILGRIKNPSPEVYNVIVGAENCEEEEFEKLIDEKKRQRYEELKIICEFFELDLDEVEENIAKLESTEENLASWQCERFGIYRALSKKMVDPVVAAEICCDKYFWQGTLNAASKANQANKIDQNTRKNARKGTSTQRKPFKPYQG